jgi:hypothetical protein
MAEIKFGDSKYFTLLDLQQKLNYRQYDRLDLLSLDKLRNEVSMKIQEIQLAAKQCKEATHE